MTFKQALDILASTAGEPVTDCDDPQCRICHFRRAQSKVASEVIDLFPDGTDEQLAKEWIQRLFRLIPEF